MNKEKLAKMLEKEVSMRPQYRIPRYIKTTIKNYGLKNLKTIKVILVKQ